MPQLSFTSGEITKRAGGRLDLQRYASALETCTNMLPQPHGGIARRAGTEYIATCKSGATLPARLLPFEFSTTQAYILEFGQSYIRFYMDGGQIQYSGSPYEVATNFTSMELRPLKFTQSADQLYLTHKKHKPSILSRTGHTAWTLADIDFDWPAFGTVNATTITLEPQSLTLGNFVTVLASGSLFTTDWVGDFIKFDTGYLSIDSFQTATQVTGTVMANIWLASSAPIRIQGLSKANPCVVTWVNHGMGSGGPYTVTFAEITQTQWDQLANPSYPSTDTYNVTTIDANTFSIPYNTSSFVAGYDFTVDKGTIRRNPPPSNTTNWARSAWNENDGYPNCVMFFEERLMFASTPAKPQTIWGSVSGDYENFNGMVGSTITDTDAVEFTISSDQVNAIRWMSPGKKLILGTTGGEWLMSGANDAGISPSNIKCSPETPEGVADIMPVNISGSTIFVQKSGDTYGKKVKEFGYVFSTDKYVASDLTILAEHLTRTLNIVDMDFQSIPNQILWCVREDGKQIALTYLKEHEVIGWSVHDFSGVVESEVVIPGPNEDESWKIIKRTINSATVRYIERLKETWDGSDVKDCFFVDCGLTYNGIPTNVITGLGHLEGEQVAILADGIHVNNATVSSASITLATAASKAQIGRPITTEVKTLRGGTVQEQGHIKRISSVTIRFFETAGIVYIGSSSSDMDAHDLGTTPVTKDINFTMPTGYDTDAQVYIKKTDPYPMTILAIIPHLEDYNAFDQIST